MDGGLIAGMIGRSQRSLPGEPPGSNTGVYERARVEQSYMTTAVGMQRNLERVCPDLVLSRVELSIGELCRECLMPLFHQLPLHVSLLVRLFICIFGRQL